MARSMWKGAIQFGLVTIPVKLYTATESDYAIRFNMLHATDLSRIQMKVWCPEDEKVISRGDTVKGYEYSPDQYIVITDEDLDKVPLKTVRSIEIEQFAPRDAATEEHAKFTKQSYYIEPDKIGRKAFYLLRQVLADKGSPRSARSSSGTARRSRRSTRSRARCCSRRSIGRTRSGPPRTSTCPTRRTSSSRPSSRWPSSSSRR